MATELIEFIDKDHKVAMKYYDIVELSNDSENRDVIKKELKKLIKKDPYFFDSYIHLLQILQNEGHEEEALALLNDAYSKCLEIVLDKKREWPDRIEWGWLENRHILRLFLNKAINDWEAGETELALNLFRRLLKICPNDNMGVRDFILAIRMEMSFQNFENKFNKGGYYDSDSLNWFDKNSKKFPDEFKHWLSEISQ